MRRQTTDCMRLNGFCGEEQEKRDAAAAQLGSIQRVAEAFPLPRVTLSRPLPTPLLSLPQTWMDCRHTGRLRAMVGGEQRQSPVGCLLTHTCSTVGTCVCTVVNWVRQWNEIKLGVSVLHTTRRQG